MGLLRSSSFRDTFLCLKCNSWHQDFIEFSLSSVVEDLMIIMLSVFSGISIFTVYKYHYKFKYKFLAYLNLIDFGIIVNDKLNW